MGTGYYKLFGQETQSFWCCTGTGMENYVKLDDSVYFHGTSDLYVNMYISSTLNWKDRGLSLTATADLPLSDTVSYIIDKAPEGPVKIKFRNPYWVDPSNGVTVAVNGTSFDAPKNDGYLDVKRVWHKGDTIDLSFSMKVQVSRLPDASDVVAFTYGPLVLSAGLGTERMVSTSQWASRKATIPEEVEIKDFIGIEGIDIDGWIDNIGENLVQTPGTLEFTLQGTDSDNTLVFTPHYQRYTDRYGIYSIVENRVLWARSETEGYADLSIGLM